MRCPDCNKFVSYDTDVEPEEQDDPQYDGTTLTVEVRRVLACGECGGELKEAMLELEADVLVEHTDECQQKTDGEWVDPEGEGPIGEPDPPEEPDYVVEAEYEATERMQTHDRHGKPIKSMRYMRTYYGVQVSGVVKCERCGAEATFEAENEEQASGFDELV